MAGAKERLKNLTSSGKGKRRGGTRSRREKENQIATVQDTDQFGSQNKMFFFFCKVMLLLDIVIGAACLAYGITLHINKKYAEYGNYFIFFGLLVLISSFLGFFGFASSAFKRGGLLFSAYCALVIGFMEVITTITLIYSKKDFFKFISKHHVDFDLTNDEVASIESFFIPVCGLGIVFGLAELIRFYALRKLRDDLTSIETVVSARHSASAEPLLDDDDIASEDTDSDFAPVDGQLYTDGNWWADKNQFDEIVKDENSTLGNSSSLAKESEQPSIIESISGSKKTDDIV